MHVQNAMAWDGSAASQGKHGGFGMGVGKAGEGGRKGSQRGNSTGGLKPSLRLVDRAVGLSTAQCGSKASSQLASTSWPGVEVSPASPAARSIFSAYSAGVAAAEPPHNVLNPVQQGRLPQGSSSPLH